MSRRRAYRDPVTGDALTWSEHLSWLAQGVIRRWTVLVVISGLTAASWTYSAIAGHPSVLVWWNLAASYLALVIEGTVGIAMFSQTRRDAVILREIRQHVERTEALERAQNRALIHLETLLQHHGISNAEPSTKESQPAQQGTTERPPMPAYQPNPNLVTYIEKGDAGAGVEKRG